MIYRLYNDLTTSKGRAGERRCAEIYPVLKELIRANWRALNG
ncbi:unnamed protein product, partial [Musa hybrid cultivar]